MPLTWPSATHILWAKGINTVQLGSITDLGTFLFECDRASLQVYRPILNDIQRDECFYCRGLLKAAGEVDHSIPWTRYPTDLGHNFVLAHAGCNNSKSDYLAAVDHLGAWQERNRVHCEELVARLQKRSLASPQIAGSPFPQRSCLIEKLVAKVTPQNGCEMLGIASA